MKEGYSSLKQITVHYKSSAKACSNSHRLPGLSRKHQRPESPGISKFKGNLFFVSYESPVRLRLRSKLRLTAMPTRSVVNCDFPSSAVPNKAPDDSVVLAKMCFSWYRFSCVGPWPGMALLYKQKTQFHWKSCSCTSALIKCT